MKFANKECADCHVILPANEMAKRTDRVNSGSTDRYSRAGSYYKRTGTTQSYRNKTVFLCAACVEKRRARRERDLGLVAGIGAAILAVVMISSFGTSSKESDIKPGPEARETPLASVVEVESSQGPYVAGLTPRPDKPLPADKPSTTAPVVRTNNDQEILAYIENYVQLALSDDHDSEWSQGDYRGKIEVSAAPANGDRLCRQYKILVLGDEGSRLLKSGTRCATMGNGGWVDI